MKVKDFEYDGIMASEQGIVPCSFDSDNQDTINYGSKINFDTVSMRNGKEFELVNAGYDEAGEFTFQICKMENKNGNHYFSTDEQRFVYRWLNRNDGFHTLKIITIDNQTILFEGSFNIEVIEFCGQVIGFELTFTMGKPFATQETKIFSHTFSANEKYIIIDESDDIGYIYPVLKITCKSNGDLKLYNSIEDRTTIIKNCKSGEVISVDKNLNISTSISSHKLYNDFNFVFFRIANSYADNKNIISVNIPCEIKFEYCPIVKGVGL